MFSVKNPSTKRRPVRFVGGESLEQFHAKSNAQSYCLLNERTDEQLVQTLADGDQKALAVLFDRYHRLVYRVALCIVRDAGEAEEVVQTVFFDFFRALARFDPRKGRLKVWLLQYAYHRAMNRKRNLAASRFYKWVGLQDAGSAAAFSWRPSEVVEVARLTEQLLSGLSPGRREILELTYYEGLTAEEIAIRLGQSVNVVRHELYRGLASLRRLVAWSRSMGAQGVHADAKGAMGADARPI